MIAQGWFCVIVMCFIHVTSLHSQVNTNYYNTRHIETNTEDCCILEDPSLNVFLTALSRLHLTAISHFMNNSLSNYCLMLPSLFPEGCHMWASLVGLSTWLSFSWCSWCSCQCLPRVWLSIKSSRYVAIYYVYDVTHDHLICRTP